MRSVIFGIDRWQRWVMAAAAILGAVVPFTPAFAQRMSAVREVPLDFSPIDTSIPIPVSVSYNGGKRVGAAGLGWDVPLSIIYRDTTAAHRRPESATQGHERMTLVLLGESINLVRAPITTKTVWVADRGHPQLEVNETNTSIITVYDGDGRTYTFDNRRPQGTQLANRKFYLLTTITAPGGRQVQLNYTAPSVTLPSGAAGVEINLTQVVYNAHPTQADCFKGSVDLVYDNDAASPLSMQMLGSDMVLTRSNKLQNVYVRSKAACGSPLKTLRKYNFDYTDPTTHQPQLDPDTGLPRLRAVTMNGQEGTAEANVSLPVASYDYGSIVDPTTHKITYDRASYQFQPETPTNVALADGITRAKTEDSPEPHSPSDILSTLRSLAMTRDFNGDGRADYYDDRILWYNHPGGNSDGTVPVLIKDVANGGGGVFTPFDLSDKIQSTKIGGANLPANSAMIPTVSDTLREVIDINGDGRPDVVETVLPDIDHWIIHLNTPDSNPRRIVWVDITVPVARMRAALNTTGFNFGRVPLKRDTTTPRLFMHCWGWNSLSNQWIENTTTTNRECTDSVGGEVVSLFPDAGRLPQTITEFALLDVNGDGYPDFVYDASRVNMDDNVNPPPPVSAPHDHAFAFLRSPGMIGSQDIKVLINTAGARLASGVDLFSDVPVTLESGGASGCGITRSIPDPSYKRSDGNVKTLQICGFGDINGDGIVDRVTSTVTDSTVTTAAALGTGDFNAPYSTSAVVALPGPMLSTGTNIDFPSETGSIPTTTCFVGQFFSSTSKGLVDLNGDGILDYLSAGGGGQGQSSVAMGTGVGFTAPTLVVNIASVSAPSVTLSSQSGDCGSKLQGTNNGLWDIDGDGQPEFLDLRPAVSRDQTTIDVMQLKRWTPQMDVGVAPSIPEAGQLTAVSNGYGATTRFGYRSAKQEETTLHQVPGPEIVLASVATTSSSSPNTFLTSPLRYAYGDISMYFDAAADRFLSTGYRRSIELRNTVDDKPNAGVVTITQTNGPSLSQGSAGALLDGLLRKGTIDSTIVLSDENSIGTNPWAFLSASFANDSRRIAGENVYWAARILPAGVKPAGNTICLNFDPYHFDPSQDLTVNGDVCVQNGFAFQTGKTTWRGHPGTDPFPALNANVVATDTAVEPGHTDDHGVKIPSDVDDFGRVLRVQAFGDLNRNGDEQCTSTTYANPPSQDTRPRVLNAPAQRIVTDCGTTPKTLSKTTWEYDTSASGVKLPAGKVSNGFVTAQIVTRLDENGNPINDASGKSDIRLFDATINASGLATSVTSTRDDGANRTVSTSYDAFNLAPISSTITAKNADNITLPAQTASLTRDPLTLTVSSTTDANGQTSGTTFDGFGRVRTSTMTPSTGPSGVWSSITYQGFALGESGGRSTVQKVFTDPVAPANVATAAGRTGTTIFDALGRTLQTEVNLGADYGNQIMIGGKSLYDLQGRVKFVADPFPSTQSFATAYGTTSNYNADGTPNCMVRGAGVRANTNATDEAAEIYPSCYNVGYENHTQIAAVQDASARLAGSPQADVQHWTRTTALGQPIETWTFSYLESKRLEYQTHEYDHLGRHITMSRFQGAAAGSNPLITQWHYDSLGQVTELDEPAPNAPQFRSYDTWGALTSTGWCDPALGTCPTPATAASINRSSITRYDALARTIHREDRSNGTAIAETVNDYFYDTAVNNTTPAVTATNVLGRLAKVTSPTLSQSFSYDPYGRTNAVVYTDRTAASGNIYVEKHDYLGDGSVSSLHLLLPDSTGFVDEHVDYAYDSAGRTRTADYKAGSATQNLFTESGGIDVFGRLTHASYAAATFDASYANTGRRLINDVKISTPSGKSRKVSFAGAAGISTVFDPLGRERVRTELVNDVADPAKVSNYDALGRLGTASTFANGALSTNRAFTYDALGNILTQTDPNVAGTPGAVNLSYMTTDRDRICSIGYAGAAAPVACNVTYDAVGNIASEPARTGTPRTFKYQPNGQVREIAANGATATFDYDALGAVQRLVLQGTTADKTRNDKHFGGMIDRRNEAGASKVTRTFPIPGGLATRHGVSGPWTFKFGESRGLRATTNASGEFVQDVDYRPFGEAKPCAAPRLCPAPGSAEYTNEQWNDGDLLAAFGINQLGARLYDPAIGRFLSRDPIFDAGNGFNPYAFAANDPINHSDPTGTLQTECALCGLWDSGGSGSGVGAGNAPWAGGGGYDNNGAFAQDSTDPKSRFAKGSTNFSFSERSVSPRWISLAFSSYDENHNETITIYDYKVKTSYSEMVSTCDAACKAYYERVNHLLSAREQKMYDGMVRASIGNPLMRFIYGGASGVRIDTAVGFQAEATAVVGDFGATVGANVECFSASGGGGCSTYVEVPRGGAGYSIGASVGWNVAAKPESYLQYAQRTTQVCCGDSITESWKGVFHNYNFGAGPYGIGVFTSDPPGLGWFGISVSYGWSTSKVTVSVTDVDYRNGRLDLITKVGT